MATATTYSKFELIRLFRNRQNLGFSVLIPVLMFFLIAVPNKNNHNFGGDRTHHTGLFAPQYYMISLLAFGGLAAILSIGPRIAAERVIGWNRMLRLTPLTPGAYLRTKVLTGYASAGIAIVLLYVLGIAFDVRMGIGVWVELTVLVLVALVPYAGLGIGLGHLLNADAAGAATGIGASLFAFLGGAWFPITAGGLQDFSKLLPSFWLTRAGNVGYVGVSNPWGVEGWIVVTAWSAAATAFAMWAYRRDTRRA